MVRMFLSCCSCESAAEADGEVITTTSGKKNSDPVGSGSIHGKTSAGAGSGGDAGPTAMDITACCPEKEDEKRQIQQLVRSFIKAAVGGVDCTYLHLPLATTGTAAQWKKPAKYVIDKQCTKITIRVEDSSDYVLLLDGIKEAFSYEDIDEGLVGSTLVTKKVSILPEEERNRVVVLQYEGSEAQLVSLLMRTEQDKDLFLVAVSVLRLYAQHSKTRYPDQHLQPTRHQVTRKKSIRSNR